MRLEIVTVRTVPTAKPEEGTLVSMTISSNVEPYVAT